MFAGSQAEGRETMLPLPTRRRPS